MSTARLFMLKETLLNKSPSPQAALETALPKKSLVYQGVLNLGHGIELMIDAMPFIPDYHLVICGAGDIEQQLKKQAEKSSVSECIHFLSGVEPNLLAGIAKRADLGFSLEQDLRYNYRNALPNKIFSYLNAQIPTICSNLPVMAELVQENAIGEILIDRSPQALAELVLQVKNNRSKYLPPLQKAVLTLNWKQESEKLKQLINRELL